MATINALLLVAAGGALGASARYGVSLALINSAGRFPFATLTVNILGSFLLGLLFAYSQHTAISEGWRLFLAVGVLGAFTTFSTFSVEVVALLQQGELGKGLLHAGLNMILCIATVALAIVLMNHLLNLSVK